MISAAVAATAAGGLCRRSIRLLRTPVCVNVDQHTWPAEAHAAAALHSPRCETLHQASARVCVCCPAVVYLAEDEAAIHDHAKIGG